MLAMAVLLFCLSVATAANSPNKFLIHLQRSAVNYVPPVALEYIKRNASQPTDDEILGPYYASFLLPSRTAVEKIPTIEER